MKRSVIAAVICLGMLTGCGRVDTAPVDSSPVEITASETTKITAAADKDESETTVKTESKQTTENTKETKSSKTTTSTANAQLVRRSSPAVTRQPAAAPAPVRTAAKTAAAPATTTKITGNAPVQTTLTTSTTVTTTSSAKDNDPKIVSKDNIVCEVKKDGVDVFIDGENMHTIEADTKAMLDVYETNEITQESLITIFDFNGDSINDIFIPTEISKDSVSGVYYRYDAEEKKYVEWEEMKDIKKLINVSKTDFTFTVLDKKDSVEYEERTYGWDGEKPVLRKMQKQYNASADPWDILIDYYEYPDGEEKLVKREKLVFNDAHEITDTQEVELD